MERRPYRLVVGFDGSESSVRALERAAGLAAYGSRLAVVHVARHVDDREGQRLLADADRRLLPMRVFFEPVQCVGDPAAELIRAAQERDADILVVGDGKNAPQEATLGSVCTTILRHAPCDTLVVH